MARVSIRHWLHLPRRILAADGPGFSRDRTLLYSSNTYLAITNIFCRCTGKSFLLTTVYLWCIVNGKRCKAAAPTGIAAANVEIEGTDVSASTIHTLFDLDTEFKSKLDFAKLSNTRVADLMAMGVLLLDEAPHICLY